MGVDEAELSRGVVAVDGYSGEGMGVEGIDAGLVDGEEDLGGGVAGEGDGVLHAVHGYGEVVAGEELDMVAVEMDGLPDMAEVGKVEEDIFADLTDDAGAVMGHDI